MTLPPDLEITRKRRIPAPSRASSEKDRLQALYDLGILDTAPDPDFDRITRLAAAIFGTPLAFISFLDGSRQWFKSSFGAAVTERPRDVSFCAYTILDDAVMVVPDAQKDERFRQNPIVRDHPKVRFYAGAPIVTSQGQNVGTLCVLDIKPRTPLTPEQETILITLANLAREAAERHQAKLEREKKDQEVRQRYALVARTAQPTSHGWDSRDRMDSLTGLPSRGLLLERLSGMIVRSQAEQRWDFAVLSLDVDRFAGINQRYGFIVGEALLKGIAHRISEVIAQTRSSSHSMAARIAEDEFVILLGAVQNGAQAEAVAQRIHNALTAPIDCGGELLHAGVSIGIVLAHPDRRDPESFLQKSDLAMYQAKVNGRNLSETFDPATQEKTMRRMELEQDLRTAVAFDQLRLGFQPQINLHNGELIGCEALVRWQHPRLGLLMPADFITLAEETGVISDIDLWVLEHSCAQLAVWRQMPGVETLKMSVNFSAQHLPRRGLKAGVQRLLQSHNLPPAALCLELTESVLDADVEARVGLMEELRSIGVGLHMDDFGSGYSSFKQLYELPFDTLKIDRSFMDKILDEAKARKIVEGILGLTKLIGLKVVAEGVEDPRQAALLLQMGCDFGQGFLYDRPLDADTFCRRYLLHRPTAPDPDQAAPAPDQAQAQAN